MKRLENKIAIVTGATSGIGKDIAQEFAVQGARVLLTGRNQERAEAAMAQAVERGAPRENMAFHRADLTSAEDCRSIVERAVQEFGTLDIVVNNAGDVSRSNIENITLEEWDRQMAINLRAPFLLTQAAVPHLKARGCGSIVNIGSVNAYIGELKLLAYAASKGGLMTFSKNVANYLTRYRIRVNLLNVGWTLTEGEKDVMRRDTGSDDWLEAAEASRPMGRLLRPQDISMAAVYFASDESSMVTGSVLDVEQHPVGAPTLPFAETVD